jgi:hypothetical protein
MRSIMSGSKVSIKLDVFGHLIPDEQGEVSGFTDELVMPVAVQMDHKAG